MYGFHRWPTEHISVRLIMSCFNALVEHLDGEDFLASLLNMDEGRPKRGNTAKKIED